MNRMNSKRNAADALSATAVYFAARRLGTDANIAHPPLKLKRRIHLMAAQLFLRLLQVTRVPPFAIPFCFAVWLLSCSACTDRQKEQAATADKIFTEAAAAKAAFEYDKALRLFSEAAKIDTVAGRAEAAARCFTEIADVQLRTGALREAQQNLTRVASLTPAEKKSERRRWIKQQIDLHLLLSEPQDAIRKLHSIEPLADNENLQLARIYIALDSVDRAQYFYSLVKNSADVYYQVEGYAGLARIFDGYTVDYATRRDSSAFFLNKIAELQKAAMNDAKMDADQKFRTGRAAAEALSEFEPRLKDASWFMNKTLALVAKSTNPESDMLRTVLAAEVNAMVTLRAENFEKALRVFETRSYALGTAYASTMAGLSADYPAERRIELLQKGIALYSDILYAVPSPKMAADFERGFYKLVDLLCQRARYLEAYETSEKIRMLEQRKLLRGGQLNTADASVAGLIREMQRLEAETAALQCLQDSLAFIDAADAAARQPYFERLLGEKQGQFYDKLGELQAKNPNAAEFFRPKAVTLASLQTLLPEGTAVAEVFHADSLATIIFITKKAVEAFRTPVAKAELSGALSTYRGKYFRGIAPSMNLFKQDADRLRLTEIFYTPLENSLPALTKLYFVSSLPVPFHSLGTELFLGQQVEVSYLTSTKQLELGKNITAPRTLDFTSLGDAYTIAPKFFDRTKESILLFAPLSEKDLSEEQVVFELMMRSNDALSKLLKGYAKENISKGETDWIWFCAYGY